MTERPIFVAALEFKDFAARRAYVFQACGEDVSLRQRVEALLQTHDQAGSFLESPPPETAQTIDIPVPERLGNRIGPYKLLQELGEGGMGTVFLAEQTHPIERKVALKIIKAGMDSRQVIARFEAERQALALMDHPNIAKVLDASTTDTGQPFFVMELVKGIPITKYCDHENLTPRERLELFIPVCQAVQHAHQKGLIHRDLKPSNVLIALYDGRPVPKVIDFGVAKATAQRLTERTMFTEVGAIVGTLEYMAPEQAELNNLDIDTRADIYSLGVILYELLTGSPPFTSKQLRSASFDEMLRMIREVEPSRPSTKLSSSDELPAIAAHRKLDPKKLTRLIHGDLDWIVMKALEKDRGRRYETANGFAMDLQRYLADEPVLAGPPSMTYRLRKFYRRNRGPVLTVVALLLLLIGGIVGTTWGLMRAQLARDKAEYQRGVADAQRVRAEGHQKKAFEVVERMLTRVGDKELVNVPHMDETRRRLLEDALEFYRGFLKDDSTDPAVRQETARAYSKTAHIYRLLGRHDQAEEAWRHASDIQRALLSEFPDAPSYRQELAVNHCDRGRLYFETGRSPQAEAAYLSALDIQQVLARDHPAVAAYQLEMLGSYSSLGNLYLSTSRPDVAESIWAEAARVAKELVQKFSDDPDSQAAFARSLHNLGDLYRQTGRQEESKAALLRARDIRVTLVVAYPEDPNHQDALSGTLNNLGIVYRALGRLDDAEASYLSAIDVKKKLAADHPELPDYQMGLAKAYNNLGYLYSLKKQADESISAYQEALTLHNDLARRYPKRLEYAVNFSSSTLNWARHLQESGRAEESLDFFERCIRHLEDALQIEPRHEDAIRNLHNAHFNRAIALDKLDRPAEAVKDWQRVVELGEGQRHENYRFFRPKALAYLGEHARAMAALDAVVPDAPQQAWLLEEFGAVCGLSAAAAANDDSLPQPDRAHVVDQYAARSVVFLSRAAEAGLYMTASQVEKLTKDRRLEALRGREDFTKLVAELEAKAKP
jgi:eukaryotic-like serine/threonine-protein kinase